MPPETPTTPHVLVCVHGLTRQSRDFDVLAQHLAPHMRVVCPDVVGRGHSDWLANPAHYQVPQYAADMLEVRQEIAQLREQNAKLRERMAAMDARAELLRATNDLYRRELETHGIPVPRLI
mgnify:CR=1 FL=1